MNRFFSPVIVFRDLARQNQVVVALRKVVANCGPWGQRKPTDVQILFLLDFETVVVIKMFKSQSVFAFSSLCCSLLK